MKALFGSVVILIFVLGLVFIINSRDEVYDRCEAQCAPYYVHSAFSDSCVCDLTKKVIK